MNCRYCGAPPMFKAGDRVKLNSEWTKASGGIKNYGYEKGREGVVTGPSRIEMCTMVLFDGDKRPSFWHQSFFTKIRRSK